MSAPEAEAIYEGIVSEQNTRRHFLQMEIKGEIHKQVMRERWQRLIIGWIVGPIVVILPFFLLKWLWAFIDILPSSDKSEMWTLVTFMFSSTYIAVIALYGGLIAAVFQKVSGAKTDDSTSDKNDKS